MKKILNYIALIVLLTIVACNDEFMERYPLDALSDQSYWKSPKDLELFANSFYPVFRTDVAPERKFVLDDNSDNQVPLTKNLYVWNLESPQPTHIGWNWSLIGNANYFLAHYQTVKGDLNLINSYVGEIKFFRAWEYFKLVKLYGDVPWINKALGTNDVDYLNKARDSRKLVMDSILADINYAVNNLYAPEKVAIGRLNKNAALAFKSRVCLYEGTYRKYHNLGDYAPLLTQAIDAAQTLISSGKYALYSTGKPEDDYYQLSIIEKKNTIKECILAIDFKQPDLMNDISHNIEAECYSGSGLSKDLIESYLCRDGKPIKVSSLYLGDDSLSMEIIGRDPRLWQTVLTQRSPFRSNDDGTNPSYIELPRKMQWQTTMYQQNKDRSPYNKDYVQNSSIIGQFIFKYSEVLLNYAEAKAELGTINQSDLDMTINLLRDRVNVGRLNLTVGFTDPNWKDYGYSLSPLLQEIRRERRVELACEGFRWDDIVRWKAGKLFEAPKSLLGLKIVPKMIARYPKDFFKTTRFTSDGYIQFYAEPAITWNDRLYLHWIPTQEITLNPKLQQNPGW